MTFRGHIKNGVAVLDESVALPDGTPVRVEVERVDAAFWEGKGAAELAREQGAKPATSVNDLAANWPEDESVDDFLALIRRSRV
jgi:hypothetical protein